MKRSKNRWWLRAVVVAVVAALIYATKPRPPEVDVHAAAQPAGAADHGSAERPAAGEGHHEEATLAEDEGQHVEPVSDEQEREPEPAGAAPGAGQEQVSAAEHDARDAVVRTADKMEAPAPRERPRVTPNWHDPVDLTFRRLKQIYRGFRKAKDFTPEEVAELNGAGVTIKGAIMPIDPVGEKGRLKRFWIAKPTLVMAGCVFCNPPTMADLVYVTTSRPLKVDRERLYRSVVMIEALGRLELGPAESDDGVEYLFGLQLKKVLDI
ncbi:MAG: hypothetical protein JRI55_29545 [Deltaproteobacteria bacterium]|jgi:hypothetical protein|nr:hypothetical protein [Deltaproteobacteria bacterium]